MKKTFFVFLFSVAFVASANAQLPMVSYSSITNQWFEGSKTNILQIAEQRALISTNDIVGAYLRLEYDLAFAQVDTISNSIQRVLDLGETITTPNYQQVFRLTKGDLEFFLVFLTQYSHENIPEDRSKAAIIHKPMNFRKDFEALWKDGFLAD